ncbi:RNA binding protein [Penicillium citrinum]|uniref:RNA binding protein n=2 Tax=Penicillium TaxID=5073 RepID=A0A9W9NY95_PENCI|nr:RNA binding protein [Penicillium citrinum]KAJ5231845.1 RNA binding protein [Penicillium citrinum]KAJ5579378.1 RNA binding protein [Penicillium hetheringtonii]KAK5787957.1 hypothetical protein VI817_010453 [Penicillium citrinum]
MARGNDTATKVFYKGKSEDFIVFVDDVEILKKWKNDRSIPLADVVNGWKIFVTHRHGAQGIMDGASKSILADEFGSEKEDDCIVKILENGEYQNITSREREGGKNDANGSR